MAEAVATISLLSSIIQLVDFGTRLVTRLDEFTSATEEVPASFRSIKSQLPLAINTLQRVQEQARVGRVSHADARVLKPVVDNCLEKTKDLMAILDQAVPTGNFSTLRKRIQALKSLRYDKKVQKNVERLQHNIQILIFYQTTHHSDIIQQLTSQLSLSPPPQTPSFSFGLNITRAPQVADGTFVGRETELSQLDEWLIPRSTPPSQNVVAIAALGGLGKTQLSITFAQRHQKKFSSVFWLNAKDEFSLKQDFISLSQIIDIDSNIGSGSTGLVDDEFVVQQVQRWLSHPDNHQWLLIFDNYDDPKLLGVKSITGYDIRRYFPSRSQGSILITTRSHRITFARQLKLRKLDDLDQSIEILSCRSGQDLKGNAEAAKLARRLDGLPLALATAGTYLGQTAESVDDYLYAYETCWHQLDENAEELVEYEDRTLFSTWNLSLAHLQFQFPDTAKLLRLLAYFANEGINYHLLRPGKDSGLPWLSSLTENKRQFDRAMACLHSYSLIEVSEGSYHLHTCVHDWILQSLNREICPRYYWLAINCIVSNAKSESDRDYWQTNQQLLPHAIRLEQKRLCRMLEEEEELNENRAEDLQSLGTLWITQRQFCKPEKIFQLVLAYREKVLGSSHISTLDIVNNFGTLRNFQGKIVEAEQLFERALTGKSNALGSDHPSTFDIVHNLGVVYRAQGKLKKAEQMYQRALVGNEKTLGPDHTSTLNTVNNLGNLYTDQMKMVQAEQMYQRALTGYEKTLGPDHTSTLDTVCNLGNLYKDQMKMVEAEQMYQRALTGYEKTLGPDHTWILNTVSALGTLYKALGKVAEMIKLVSTWGSTATNLFGKLGRLLLRNLDDRNAQIAFQQEVDLQDGCVVFANIQCDGCGGLPITCAKKRFVCRHCPDGDLCGKCLNEHQSGIQRVPSCLDHSFLGIISEGVFRTRACYFIRRDKKIIMV